MAGAMRLMAEIEGRAFVDFRAGWEREIASVNRLVRLIFRYYLRSQFSDLATIRQSDVRSLYPLPFTPRVKGPQFLIR